MSKTYDQIGTIRRERHSGQHYSIWLRDNESWLCIYSTIERKSGVRLYHDVKYYTTQIWPVADPKPSVTDGQSVISNLYNQLSWNLAEIESVLNSYPGMDMAKIVSVMAALHQWRSGLINSLQKAADLINKQS